MVKPLLESSGRIPGVVVHDMELPPGYEAQFLARGGRGGAGTKAGNKGADAAMAAIEMANLLEQL